jgi:hypothetical protein
VRTIVTKAEFAARKSRQPSAISNWIASGKISRAALVGEGVRARIWLEQAERDLELGLDPAQDAAQPVPVLGSPTLALQSPRVGAGQGDDEDIRRRRKADADRAEHDAEAARRRLAIDEGRWVSADEAARTWARELARLIADTETFLFTTLARELAQRHGLDWKTIAVEIRELFHKHRATASEDAAARREAVENEIKSAE